jgi:hypothetical protein
MTPPAIEIWENDSPTTCMMDSFAKDGRYSPIKQTGRPVVATPSFQDSDIADEFEYRYDPTYTINLKSQKLFSPQNKRHPSTEIQKHNSRMVSKTPRNEVHSPKSQKKHKKVFSYTENAKNKGNAQTPKHRK